MTNEELTRRALAVVAGRRQRALTLADDALRAARSAIPQLAEAEQQQMEAGLAAAPAGVAGAQQKKNEAALARCAALEAQRDELLRAAGLLRRLQVHLPALQRHRPARRRAVHLRAAAGARMRAAEMNAAFPLALSTFGGLPAGKIPHANRALAGHFHARTDGKNVLNYCKQYAHNFPFQTPAFTYTAARAWATHLAPYARGAAKGYHGCTSAQSAFDAMEKERYAGGDTLAALEAANFLFWTTLAPNACRPTRQAACTAL